MRWKSRRRRACFSSVMGLVPRASWIFCSRSARAASFVQRLNAPSSPRSFLGGAPRASAPCGRCSPPWLVLREAALWPLEISRMIFARDPSPRELELLVDNGHLPIALARGAAALEPRVEALPAIRDHGIRRGVRIRALSKFRGEALRGVCRERFLDGPSMLDYRLGAFGIQHGEELIENGSRAIILFRLPIPCFNFKV